MTARRKVQLGECCEIVSGATPNTGDGSYWDGDVCWATPKDLSGLQGHYISTTPRKLTELGLASCSATILPPNSVLFSSRAPIGHVAINTVPMATNQGFKSFVPGPDVDAKFLFHWLKANRSFLEGLGVGATFKEVSKSVISKVEVYLPPLAEQRRIAAILDKADALRTKRREALAQLDRLAQSIFVEMFGDPTRPEIVGKTQTEKVPLGEFVKIQTGKLDANAAVAGGPYPFFTCAVKNLEIDVAAFDCKAVLVAGNGDLNVKYYEGKFNAYQRTYVIRALNEQKLIPKFLFQFLDLYVAELRKQAIGGVIKYIKLPYLTEAPLNLPSGEMQQAFVKRLDAVHAARQLIAASDIESQRLFQTLQHRAFAGDL